MLIRMILHKFVKKSRPHFLPFCLCVLAHFFAASDISSKEICFAHQELQLFFLFLIDNNYKALYFWKKIYFCQRRTQVFFRCIFLMEMQNEQSSFQNFNFQGGFDNPLLIYVRLWYMAKSFFNYYPFLNCLSEA